MFVCLYGRIAATFLATHGHVSDIDAALSIIIIVIYYALPLAVTHSI
jgi:hypothetical protein